VEYHYKMSERNNRADKLSQILTSTESNFDEFFLVLDEHQPCFDADLCEICKIRYDAGERTILVEIANNPSINEPLQDRLLSEATKWQGQSVDVKLALASNPALSPRIRSEMLNPDEWYMWGYGNDLIQDFVERAFNNPNFPDEEIQTFLQNCISDWDFPADIFGD